MQLALQKWIKDNLYHNNSNKLISKRCRKQWFENHDLLNKYKEIMTAKKDNDISFVNYIKNIVQENLSPYCQYCGKVKKNINNTFCSAKCAQNSFQTKIKREQTTENKYGKKYIVQTDYFKEKAKKTLLEKYGVDNISKSPIIKEKKKQTCNKHFNCDYPMQSDEVKAKSINYYQTNYDVTNCHQVQSVKDAASNTRRKNYYQLLFNSDKLKNMVTPNFDINEYKNGQHTYEFTCNKCGHVFTDKLINGNVPRCLKCYPMQGFGGVSTGQIELLNYIKSLLPSDVLIINNDRSIFNDGKELDIYIPSYNLAIEYNGLYWHSENHGNKNKNYHLNKTKLCEQKGIQLLHIWDIEWIYKQNIVKSIIKSKLQLIKNKIYGRNTVIQKISPIIAKKFLQDNHIAGFINSKINLGLYNKKNNQLVAVMTFGKTRFNNNKNQWELYRYATKLNTAVIGGLSKLLKYFQKYYSSNIITFLDRRFSTPLKNYFNNNKNYKLNITQPDYWYTDYKTIIGSRLKFQKHKLNKQLNIFDNTLTEWQNMQLNNYDRVWDCGNLKYQFKLNK